MLTDISQVFLLLKCCCQTHRVLALVITLQSGFRDDPHPSFMFRSWDKQRAAPKQILEYGLVNFDYIMYQIPS